ncbi:MAG: c-type cytochrome biogenesis protein CcmI [Rhodospirillaceae bacterium]
MIWAGYAILILVSVAGLVWPVLKHAKSAAQNTEPDQAVYRAQLNEVERDAIQGLLDAEEAETARTEIKRRLLAANRRAAGQNQYGSPVARAVALTCIIILVPTLSAAVYWSIGAPGLAGAPIEERRAVARENPESADFSVLIEQLAETLRQNPESTDGWLLLARSYRQVNRMEESVQAFRQALSTGVNDPLVYAEFADTLIAANGGVVTAEAVNVFEGVLRTDRNEPRARFYLGLARAQAEDPQGAIAIWRDLTAGAPDDAPWLPMVRDQMSQVAMRAGVMPMTVTPRHPLDGIARSRSETAGDRTTDGADTGVPAADEDDFRPDVSQLAGRFSGDELTMIQEMVGGLEARLEFEPDDFDGWMQLGRSYTVLGNTEKAANAFRAASAQRADSLQARVQLANALLQPAAQQDGLSAELDAVVAEILTLDAKNADGLFISGLLAANTGNTAEARQRWEQLLQILPAGDPARDAVQARLADL